MRAQRIVVLAAAATTLLSATPRLLLAAGALPEWLRPFIWSDVYATYVARGLAGHRLPYVDVFFDYPPGIGYPAAVLSLVASDALAYTAAWTVIVALVAALFAFALWPHSGTRRTLLFWSLSPQLLLYAGSNFDVLPAALVGLAALLARSGRSASAVALLALGTTMKVFPGLSAPLEVARLWRAGASSRAWAAGLVFGAIIVGLTLPTLFVPWPSVLSVVYQVMRTNEDSIFGLALAALDNLRVPWADAVVAIVASAGLVAMYLFAVAPRALRARDAAAGFALATLALLLWTRLYSPQYSLWALPFFALLGLSSRTFALLSLADAGVFLTTFPLSLAWWIEGEPAQIALLAGRDVAVVLRHVALLLAWVEVARRRLT